MPDETRGADQVPSIHETIALPAEWLLDNQAPGGGWATSPGGQPSVLNTAETILGLMELVGALVPRRGTAVAAALKFIEGCQIREGTNAGAWTRGTPSPQAVPDLVRTAFAIRALVAGLKPLEEPTVERALTWIISVRNPDGGWGYRPGTPSEVAPTCFSLLALLDAKSAITDRFDTAIASSLGFLVQRQARDGSFGTPGPLQAAHTIYAILTLQAARRQDIDQYLAETRALDWLLKNPTAAMMQIEERFVIDSSGAQNYGFFYMTDALLSQALPSARDPRHRQSDLARQAVRSLYERIDLDDGGVYGSHKFSWSAAKTLNGLAAAAHQWTAVPLREPEVPGVPAAPLVLVFITVLSLIAAVLVTRDQFNLLTAMFLVIQLFAALLAYGLIGQRTFKELVLAFNLRSAVGGEKSP